MTTPARYFMLHGWARFLGSTNNEDIMKNIVNRRDGGNWKIGIDDDYFALQWQRYDFRKWRAQRAIGQDKMRSYRFTGDGPLTIPLAGVQIPGWETDSEMKANQADFDRMQEKRMKAHNACVRLKEMDRPYDVRQELNSLDWQESEREAMGYY